MITTQIIDTHLAHAAIRHSISKVDGRGTPKTTGDEATALASLRPLVPDESPAAIATTTAAEPRDGSSSLPEYLAFLRLQGEQIETYAKHKRSPLTEMG